MRRLVLDKIASVTRTLALGREVLVGGEIPCEEGVVLAVRILDDKTTYDQLELPSGRFARLQRGDVVAGALGHRHALFGYSGSIPPRLAPGDTVQLLNQGGVLGICDGVNPDLGPPFSARVLGAVLRFPVLGERVGVPARIGGSGATLPGPGEGPAPGGVPVVAMVGSCMNAGKTAAACALVRELHHRDKTVHALKATGVSLRRDVVAMEDAGARRTALFTDLGVVSTSPATGPAVTRALLGRLAAGGPDLIVAELGDGLLGAYGVDAILDAPDLRAAFTAVVLAANDPVAAWGGVRILRNEHGIEPALVTGPATDNRVGVRLIEERTGITAVNARTEPGRFTETLLGRLGTAVGDAPAGRPAAGAAGESPVRGPA